MTGIGLDPVFQVVSALGLIVLLIVGGGLAMRRFARQTPVSVSSLRVVASLSLGIKEKVVLIQVGDEQLLIGVTPGELRCLHVFDEPAVEAVEPPDFNQTLQQALMSRFGT